MPNWTLIALALAPALLVVVGLVPTRLANRRPSLMIAAARGAAVFALGSALAAWVCWFFVNHVGSTRGPTIGGEGIGSFVYYDALSGLIALLVSFVGAVVVGYSRNYLEGDPAQGRFVKWMCLTLAAVLTVAISGNLLLFTTAWIATSLCLHQLLVFYGDREAARLAARKKFIASRLGDLCLIAAMLLMYSVFGSLDFHSVFAGADALRESGTIPPRIHGIALLLVAGAMLKSAQFPFHGWLTEVMETPTPVSALLHAGIINAGGFLVLRLSGVVALSVPALETLAVVGGFTALFAAVVMLTQTSTKVSLAWSTISQMGFMMLQCGLGAFSSAALHIVAHSLYKAHAFLSAGSVIDLARSSRIKGPPSKPHPARLVLALSCAVGLTWLVSLGFGASVTAAPGAFALGAVLLMGITHLLANAIDERPSLFVVARLVGVAAGIAVGYFGLQSGVEYLMAGSLPAKEPVRGPFELAIVSLVIVLFGAVTVLQNLMPHRMSDPRWQAVYVHLFNGFYVNAIANRLVRRWWPVETGTGSQGAKA